MTTFYGILASAISAIHFCYVAYVVCGQVLILLGIPLKWGWIRNPWFRISHLLMISIVAVESLYDFECPLTTWEHDLGILAGRPGDGRSFIGAMLEGILFCPCEPNHPVYIISYVSFALLVLGTFIMWPPRFSKRPIAA